MASMSPTTIADLLLSQYGAYIAETVVQGGPGNDKLPGRSLFGVLQEYNRVFIGGADDNNNLVRDWAVHTASATAESYAMTDANPTATQESWDTAQIDWKLQRIALEYYRLTRLKQPGATRGGMNAINMDFEKKIKAMVHKINSMLATDGSGNSNKDLTGFLAFLSASNTYATIAQGSSTFWQAYTLAAGSVNLSHSIMETMVGNLVDRDAVGEDSVLLYSRAQWLKYKALFQDNLSYKAGDESSLKFAPVYEDGDVRIPIRICGGVPSDSIWFVNMNDLELRFLDQMPEDTLSSVDPAETYFMEGIPFGLTTEPTGRDSAGMVLRSYSNLACLNPYHTGKITGLST